VEELVVVFVCLFVCLIWLSFRPNKPLLMLLSLRIPLPLYPFFIQHLFATSIAIGIDRV